MEMQEAAREGLETSFSLHFHWYQVLVVVVPILPLIAFAYLCPREALSFIGWNDITRRGIKLPVSTHTMQASLPCSKMVPSRTIC